MLQGRGVLHACVPRTLICLLDLPLPVFSHVLVGNSTFIPAFMSVPLNRQLLEESLSHTTLEVSMGGKGIFSFLPSPFHVSLTYIYNKRLVNIGVVEWESRAN